MKPVPYMRALADAARALSSSAALPEEDLDALDLKMECDEAVSAYLKNGRWPPMTDRVRLQLRKRLLAAKALGAWLHEVESEKSVSIRCPTSRLLHDLLVKLPAVTETVCRCEVF